MITLTQAFTSQSQAKIDFKIEPWLVFIIPVFFFISGVFLFDHHVVEPYQQQLPPVEVRQDSEEPGPELILSFPVPSSKESLDLNAVSNL